MRATNHKHWKTACGEYALAINVECLVIMDGACVKADKSETGGVLIGYYTQDKTTAVITEISLPPSDSRAGASWFQRGMAGLGSLLRRLWQNPNRCYYVGEWHYHPSCEVEPSSHDIGQMTEISLSQSYQCREPIMLILGKPDGGDRPMRAFIFPVGREFIEFEPVPSQGSG